MTGSGTQADPYIVDSWSDFVTAVGTSNAYVELAEDTVIDMDDVSPTGISSVVAIRCTQIDGKGGEIRNLYFTNNAYFQFYHEDGIMKNLTLSNMRRDGTGTAVFMFVYNYTFINCIISGSFGGASVFNGARSTMQSCAFTIQAQNCYFAVNSYSDHRCPNFINSLLKVSGTPVLTGNPGQIFLENSLVLGTLPTKYIYKAIGTIIDCDVPDNTAVQVSNGKAYINSDKFGTGVTTTRCTQLTTEQIQSSDYLFSIGFPIGF